MFEFLETIHMQAMDADRIPYLLAAILLTVVFGMITGPTHGNANPFLWWVLDSIFGRFGDRMDNPDRPRGDLLFRGFFLCVVLLFVSGVLGRFLLLTSYAEVLVLSLFITSGSVWFIMLRLFFAMDQGGGIEGAYYGLSRSSRVDLNSTDDFGIVRTSMGYSAVAFDKGMVAPSVWYLIGGLPFVFIYCVLSFFAWRFGKCGHGSGFAAVPLVLEKLMGYVPSLFAGVLLTAASAVTPTARITKAFGAWWRVKNFVPYEQGGIVVSAMAWPLEVSLGGAVKDISGYSLRNVWIGAKDSSARINRNHLKRAIFMNVISLLLFVLSLLSAYIYAGKMGW
ncbi:MAG: cobalamin biosynthesis protein [Alphaproteobacteria bacterium]